MKTEFKIVNAILHAGREGKGSGGRELRTSSTSQQSPVRTKKKSVLADLPMPPSTLHPAPPWPAQGSRRKRTRLQTFRSAPGHHTPLLTRVCSREGLKLLSAEKRKSYICRSGTTRGPSRSASEFKDDYTGCCKELVSVPDHLSSTNDMLSELFNHLSVPRIKNLGSYFVNTERRSLLTLCFNHQAKKVTTTTSIILQYNYNKKVLVMKTVVWAFCSKWAVANT